MLMKANGKARITTNFFSHIGKRTNRTVVFFGKNNSDHQILISWHYQDQEV